MLHHSAIPTIIEKKNSTFDVEFVKRSTGDLVMAASVRCTSSHFRPRTYNLLFPNGEMRKIRHITITKINNQRIYH